jgi:hypothetical protein
VPEPSLPDFARPGPQSFLLLFFKKAGLPSFARSEHRMSLSISLTVNGAERHIPLDDPRVTLLDLLRERLHLTGTKKGCDRGQCGASTILV